MLRILRLLGSRRPRARALLSVLGIALGVALGYGVHLVNRAAVDDLAAAVRELAGDADLQVRGGRGGFPDALYPQIAGLAGVASASPRLELDAGIAGMQRTLRVIGVDVLREPTVQGDARLVLLKPDRVFLSPQAAETIRGERLQLVVGQKVVELRVAGVLPLKGFVALADVSTVQWRLERVGELNRIDVRLARGASAGEVSERIAGLLPPGVFVSPAQQVEAASSYPSRAYRINLNVLALVALFTGGFLVFSAQALEVARRRGEHALLRVLGIRKSGIAQLVLLEAAALGALGGILGVALGYAIAFGAVRTLGADLGAGAFRGVFPALGFSPVAASLYCLSGVLVALAGGLLPALDAARTPPARALKAGDEQAMFQRIAPAWPGMALLLFGAAFAQLGPIGGLPLFGYVSIACVLLGSIALMPQVAQFAFRYAPSFRSPSLVLALAQLRGAPGQAAVSLAAIVASFSLMAAMAIMVTSFRESVDRWLETILPAELYMRTTHSGDTGYLEPGFEERVRKLPQVARVDFLRSGRVVLDPSRPALSLIARDRAEKAFPLVGARYERRAGDPPPVWVSEAVADLYGFLPSRKIELPIGGKKYPFVVSGLFRDYARQHGAILIERAEYVALTGDRKVNDAALWLAPGASVAAAMEAIGALPGGAQVEMAEPGEIRRLSLRIFDRSFAVTYAMEAVAVLVGMFGLSSSLGALVLARRREFGMLRHLGLTRRQIGAMLAAEGGLLALLGAAAGLLAGGAISLVLVYVVNRQSFNWGMELHWPFAFLFSLILTLMGLAVMTAILSGKEAMGMDPVRAVREDW